MTNEQIIINAAIKANVFTEDEVTDYLRDNGELPLHTFAAWKSGGYRVCKGEHAALTTAIWRMRKNDKIIKGEDVDTKDTGKFYLAEAYFFTSEQVERIA